MSQTTDENNHFIINNNAETTNLSSLDSLKKEIPEAENDWAVKEGDIPSVNKSISWRKTVIQLAVVAAIVGSISIVTKHLKSSSSMAGMEGMAHSKGMSMEDMMRVDGSSNPTPVRVESVNLSMMQASVSYTGSVRPYLEVTVYPRVTGQLTEYSAYPGNKVKAGQVLAKLNATELSAEVEEAIAQMEAAKAEEQATKKELGEQQQEIERMTAESIYLEKRLQRTQEVLLNSGAIARNDFDRQKSEATAAKAGLGAAKVKLERIQAQIARSQAGVAEAKVKIQRLQAIAGYKNITSPITGIVQERMADPGVVVQPGMGILKIGDYRQVRLQANVSQQNLTGVKVGSPIVARLIGHERTKIKGRVTSIFPKAGEETRTVTVEAVVDNPDGQIMAGQAVEMQIITASKPNTLSVPQAALIEYKGQKAVWVVEGKSAKPKFVTTGLTSGDRIEIINGLQPGDLVITSGYERLIENSQVAAVDEAGQPIAQHHIVNSGNTQIKLVSPQGKAVAGDNQLILAVHDSQTGKLVSVDNLEVNVTMPMKNAAPMSADVEVKPDTQPGRFLVNTYLGMGGEWEVTVKIKDKLRQGQNHFIIHTP